MGRADEPASRSEHVAGARIAQVQPAITSLLFGLVQIASIATFEETAAGAWVACGSFPPDRF